MLIIVEFVRLKSLVLRLTLCETMSFWVSFVIVPWVMVRSLKVELMMLSVLLVFCVFSLIMLWKTVVPCGIEIPSILRLLRLVLEIVMLRNVEGVGVVPSIKCSVNWVEPWRERVS